MRRAGQSAGSIHQAFTLLNGAVKWAKRNRRISRNPMVDVEKPPSTKPAREVIPPDLDRVVELIAAAFDDEHESSASPATSARSPTCRLAHSPTSDTERLGVLCNVQGSETFDPWTCFA
jgi:hypothetical protein